MKIPIIVAVFLSCFFVSGQTERVKAEKGDGIFSLLRKQGLDPSKYYTEFVKLNEANIKNGSELHLGREYLLPDAPDSFKKMALNAKENVKEDLPIFDKELAKISPKSDKLQDAVLYLLPGVNGIKQSERLQNTRNLIMRNVAKELMVHGARVYLVDELEETGENSSDDVDVSTENAIANRNQMEHFVGTINKHYLQNAGKYQRVVVLNFNETAESSKYYDVSIFHHGKSSEGERFAQTLQGIFSENSIKSSEERPLGVFQNESNLYLAKNVLPPVTMIDVSGAQKTNGNQQISISPQEKVLTNIITNGVMSDYANLSLEEEN
jgi:N-acetylmuramoyl-L-alanine amidase